MSEKRLFKIKKFIFYEVFGEILKPNKYRLFVKQVTTNKKIKNVLVISKDS